MRFSYIIRETDARSIARKVMSTHHQFAYRRLPGLVELASKSNFLTESVNLDVN